VVAGSSGDLAWVAADAATGCEKGAPECVPDNQPSVHVTGLARRDGKSWKWIAIHAGTITSAKADKQPAALPGGSKGADEIVQRFTTTMADPKALVASVSSRKDVVLYGSGLAERAVGGRKVKAMLKRWGFAFKPRDGVHAGIAGTVAWVAANVDATKGGKSSPYRVLAIYEKTAGAWQLVQLHFSI
jgi:SnoaL-like domain